MKPSERLALAVRNAIAEQSKKTDKKPTISDKSELSQFLRNAKKDLNESVSPVVWHFCWFDAISSILRTDILRFSLSEVDRNEHPGVTGYRKKTPYYLCTTRSKSSHEGYSRLVSHDNRDGYARIQLDGNALNTICHGKATDYFGTRDDKDFFGKRAVQKRAENGTLGPVSDYKKVGSLIDNEKEDTVWYRYPQLPNAHKYIQRVDVLIPNKESMKENMSLCYVLKRNADRRGIPIYFYTDMTEFDRQSDKTFTPQVPPSESRS